MTKKTTPRAPRRRYIVDAHAAVMAKLDSIRAAAEARRPKLARRRKAAKAAAPSRPGLRLVDLGRLDEPAPPPLGTPVHSAFHRLTGGSSS